MRIALFFLLAAMAAGQEKPCPHFEDWAKDIAFRHIANKTLIDEAFSVDCLPVLLSEATTKRVNELEAERLDIKPEPEFVPAVKKEVQSGQCFIDMQGCEVTDKDGKPADPLGESWKTHRYWRMTCANPKRVLLHSEDGEIHVCMKIPAEEK